MASHQMASHQMAGYSMAILWLVYPGLNARID
jgi:hypothetical protein